MEAEGRHEEIEKICDRFFTELSEYVDCAQLVLSFVQGQTHLAEKGFGNYYARVGMCQSFLKKDEARDGLEVEYSEYRSKEDL